MSSLMTFLAVFAGGTCGAKPEEPPKPAPDDASIKAFVAHLAKNGVELKPELRGWWVVADPKGDGYQVVVHLRTFPAGATEQEMRDELMKINLAYTLNAPSRMAMSHPSLRVADLTKQVPKLDQIPVVAKLEKLFKEYRPPEPKK